MKLFKILFICFITVKALSGAERSNFLEISFTEDPLIHPGPWEDDILIPLFFDVDKENRLHIPDYFNDRILILNFKGEVLDEITVTEGLHSAQNYFSLFPDGYLTYCNNTLYRLNLQGEVEAKRSFPLGFIPNGLYLSDGYIFLGVPGVFSKDPRAEVLDAASLATVGLMGNKEKKIPMVAAGEDVYAFNLKDQKEEAPEAWFLSYEGEESYWLKRDGQNQILYILNDDIIIEDMSVQNGEPFWLIVRNDRIYRNLLFDKKLVIEAWDFTEDFSE